MRPVLHCFTVWHELTQIILSEFFLYISQIKSIEFRTLWQIHYTRLRASDPIDCGLVFGQSRYICFCARGFRTWPSIPAVRTPPTASVQRSPPPPCFIAANPVNRWCTQHQSKLHCIFQTQRDYVRFGHQCVAELMRGKAPGFTTCGRWKLTYHFHPLPPRIIERWQPEMRFRPPHLL